MEYKWKKICDSESELNNMFQLSPVQTFIVFGKKVCLVKGSDAVYAVQERCPHNGASLSGGYCNDKDEIICPLHRYPFNIKTGRASAGMALSLDTYPVKIQDDGVFLGMQKKWWEM
jgi:nitrite reductase/ring-hydroxylating ferredoxin subunit